MTSELSVFAARLRELIPLWLESGAADAAFNDHALRLFALQFRHNPSYRKFCEARKVTPALVTQWQDIPAVPTSAFKEFDFTCLSPEERTAVFHSSGTTEQKPSRHFHCQESLEVYHDSLLPWFERNVGCNLRLLMLTPSPAQVPHSSLVHMFETIRKKTQAPEPVFYGTVESDGAWKLDCDSVASVLSVASEEGKPVLLLGTAFSFVHLVDWLGEHDLSFKLPAGSRVMETGGYKGRSRTMPKAELHALITQHLGVPASEIICEYGMSELSSQAYSTEQNIEQRTGNPHPGPLPSDGRGGIRGCATARETALDDSPTQNFQFPPWAKVQIISAETGREVAEGETGLIRVFDLANVFSVMAIQTEDLGVKHNNGFELLGRATEAEPRGCSLMASGGQR